MHELALAQSIVGIVAREAEARGFSRVRVLRLEAGAFGPLEEDALRFCFGPAARGTPAEGAALEILWLPGQGFCLDCVATVPLAARFDPCPQCGGDRIHVAPGDLRVKDLEVE